MWHTEDLVKIATLLATGDGQWVNDFRLKYVHIQVDIRDGAFLLFDRDRKPISKEELLSILPGGDKFVDYGGKYSKSAEPQPKDQN